MSDLVTMPIRSSDSGERYVLFAVDGMIGCSCGDFVHRRTLGRDECKHIRQWKRENIPPGAASRGRVVDEAGLFY